VLYQCSLGDRKGIRPVKNWIWMLVCCWWRFDWSFACLTAPVVTTTSVIISSNEIQNEDILVPANPGPRGKMAVITESEREMYVVAAPCLCWRPAARVEKAEWTWAGSSTRHITHAVDIIIVTPHIISSG